jgi:hypothetical protein
MVVKEEEWKCMGEDGSQRTVLKGRPEEPQLGTEKRQN